MAASSSTQINAWKWVREDAGPLSIHWRNSFTAFGCEKLVGLASQRAKILQNRNCVSQLQCESSRLSSIRPGVLRVDDATSWCLPCCVRFETCFAQSYAPLVDGIVAPFEALSVPVNSPFELLSLKPKVGSSYREFELAELCPRKRSECSSFSTRGACDDKTNLRGNRQLP